MSNNRLLYDKCVSGEEQQKYTNSLDYIINPIKYENDKKCRHEFGLVGGPAVSEINGNKTDLESVLKGLGSTNSSCINGRPTSEQKIVIEGQIRSNERKEVDTSLRHLESCQILNIEPVQLS
uniref:Uncharacterized protein n=1 Tax=viral metagenome TaxID=1070528 RepID=A0A6C0B4L1_9ZZZZ